MTLKSLKKILIHFIYFIALVAPKIACGQFELGGRFDPKGSAGRVSNFYMKLLQNV